jgi:hypothetical protein
VKKIHYLTPALVSVLFLLPAALQCCCLYNFQKAKGCCDTEQSPSDCSKHCIGERDEFFLAAVPKIPFKPQLIAFTLVKIEIALVQQDSREQLNVPFSFYQSSSYYLGNRSRAPPSYYT